ncbi:MAG: omptin family outer membrane protease [Treponema sp.]|jgi:outer membrane protease|nr:omptin family outer membrane protease [Treponema sp.]
MRIITVFAVFVSILLCAFPVSAQINKGYSFSLSPQFGLLYGHTEEIVYPADTKAPLLSLLLWDMKPVFYYGLLMDYSPVKPMERRSFFSSLSLKSGIPGPSGVMEDRDWMSVENAELTHYSIHDNITKEIFLLDFSAGFSFPFFNTFLVKAFINISYMNLRFFGENGRGTYARQLGDGQYAPIDDNPEKYTFSGIKVISYSQEWFYAAPGVSAGYSYKDYFLAEMSFMITPLVLCTDLDEHKTRDTQFWDYMTGGVMLEPGFKFSLAAGKWLGVSWEISWRYISGTRGHSYMKKPIGSGNYIQTGEAGAGLSMLNTALLLKVRL